MALAKWKQVFGDPSRLGGCPRKSKYISANDEHICTQEQNGIGTPGTFSTNHEARDMNNRKVGSNSLFSV